MSKRSRGTAMLLAAGGCLPEAPAVSSPKPSLGATSPCSSPPSLKKRVTDSTQSSSPGKEPPTRVLPDHLRRLQEVFEMMLSGRGLLKRRAEKVTATTLAPIVESVTKRDFKVEYVQQIKFLYPQAYDWQYIRAPCEQDKNKLEFQLLLKFERSSVTGIAPQPGTGSLGRVNEVAERAALLARATAWFEEQQAQGAPPDAPVPCAPLPPKDPNCMILGGSPMQTHRRLSSSPAHLRNSLALHHAASAMQQQQRQQAAGGSPTVHRGSEQRQQAAGVSPTVHRGSEQRQQAAGVSPTVHRGSEQPQQAAGVSPTVHRGSEQPQQAAGVSPTLHRGSEQQVQQKQQQVAAGSPTLHKGRGRRGSTEAAAPPPSLPQPGDEQNARGERLGAEDATPEVAAQGSVAGPCPADAPLLERRSSRPSVGVPTPTSPTASRLKQRPPGAGPGTEPAAGHAGGAADTGMALSPRSGSAPGLPGVQGVGVAGRAVQGEEEGPGPTPRAARRRLQLGAPDLAGEGAAAEAGGASGQCKPGSQQQQQQQQGGAAAAAAGGAALGGRAHPASEQQMVDMSAFDEHAAVQAPVQSVSTSPAGVAGGSHGASQPQASASQPQASAPYGGTKSDALLSRFMSPKSLEALQRNAAKAQQSPTLKTEADLLQSQRVLPQAMDLVRAAFGPKGPVIKQREELVEAMRQKSSLSIALSAPEAARALQQLLQHAPEMLTQEQQGGVWMIRLRRNIDVNAVRMRLCNIASQAAQSSSAPSPAR